MKMKYSVYNELISCKENEQYCYLFNFLHKRYLIIDRQLQYFVTENERIEELKERHKELFDELLKQRYIVENECDEQSECLKQWWALRESPHFYQIIVNPTMDCNLRCWYCYEEKKKGSEMEQSVMDGIIALVRKKVQSEQLRNIHLSFFGGEPLMKYNKVVLPLSKALKKICDDKGKSFSLSFTSNALLLTPQRTDEMVNLFGNFKIQIPFDGGHQKHNEIKFMPSGEDAYLRTISNLKYMAGKGVNVMIRMNITNDSVDSFDELVDDLADIAKLRNIGFSLHQVWQNIGTAHFHEHLRVLTKKIQDFNGNARNTDGALDLMPCYADCGNSVVINYDGRVYKCTARDFIPEMALGWLKSDGTLQWNEKAEQRKKSMMPPKCLGCRLLPICMKCSQRKYDYPEENCDELKSEDSVHTILKLISGRSQGSRIKQVLYKYGDLHKAS